MEREAQSGRTTTRSTALALFAFWSHLLRAPKG
jgi:hypothetical protein